MARRYFVKSAGPIIQARSRRHIGPRFQTDLQAHAAVGGGKAGHGPAARPVAAKTESKMVALIIDPAVVGSELVAPVHPSEIPAFEPPIPEVSAQVPDYERVKRPALGTG